jgi:hypothetical protein
MDRNICGSIRSPQRSHLSIWSSIIRLHMCPIQTESNAPERSVITRIGTKMQWTVFSIFCYPLGFIPCNTFIMSISLKVVDCLLTYLSKRPKLVMLELHQKIWRASRTDDLNFHYDTSVYFCERAVALHYFPCLVGSPCVHLPGGYYCCEWKRLRASVEAICFGTLLSWTGQSLGWWWVHDC